MIGLTIAAGIFNPRAVIIIGVLALLCVSDGVGPRLLPLPAFAETDPPAPAHGRGDAVSRASSRAGAATRVEMIPAPQTRAAAERQQRQTVADTPKFILPLSCLAWSQGQVSLLHDRESAAYFSRPPGRAPPRRLS